jgi:hypothetical protein
VSEFSQLVAALAGGFLGQIPFSDGSHELLEFAKGRVMERCVATR